MISGRNFSKFTWGISLGISEGIPSVIYVRACFFLSELLFGHQTGIHCRYFQGNYTLENGFPRNIFWNSFMNIIWNLFKESAIIYAICSRFFLKNFFMDLLSQRFFWDFLRNLCRNAWILLFSLKFFPELLLKFLQECLHNFCFRKSFPGYRQESIQGLLQDLQVSLWIHVGISFSWFSKSLIYDFFSLGKQDILLRLFAALWKAFLQNIIKGFIHVIVYS